MARAQGADTETTTTPPPEQKGPGGHGRHGPGQCKLKGPQGEQAQKFRESLKGLSEEERKVAIQKFRAKMDAKFKKRIEDNPKLTAEQKKEILDHMQKAQEAREKIMNDSSLSMEQKREAMEKLRETQEAARKELREKYPDAFGPPPGKPAGAPHGQPGDTPPSV
jgi:hypothetical protein